MKFNKKLFLLLIILCSFFTVNEVDAIEQKVIEENDNLSIPYFIYSTGSKVTVYDTTNYELYGQWVEITLAEHQAIAAKSDDCDDIYDEYSDYNDANRPNRDDYDTVEEYNAAVAVFNTKVDEYKEKYDTCIAEYYALVPNFDDTKWNKLADDIVYLPEESFSGTKPFILYLKLDDKQNSIIDYEFAILELNGDLEEVDDTNWKKLKSGIKTNETIALLDNDEYKVNFEESTSNEFTIEVSNADKNLSYLIILNYNNGIVTYTAPKSESEGFEFIHSIVIGGVLEEFCKLNDYDVETFAAWLETNDGKLTLEDNGIAYTMKEYEYNESGEGSTVSVSGNYFESLSINITNPITGYTNPTEDDDNEESPATGDISMIAIAGATLICAGVAVVAYRKTRFN